MNEPSLASSVETTVNPETVWQQISDITNMPNWSPQVRKSIVLGGATKLGAKFINLNRQGMKWWPTTAKIVEFQPNQKIAWRVAENRSIWSIHLAPTAAGTLITQRREAPQGISKLSTLMVNSFLGGKQKFTAEIQDGMQQTLQRIKKQLEN